MYAMSAHQASSQSRPTMAGQAPHASPMTQQSPHVPWTPQQPTQQLTPQHHHQQSTPQQQHHHHPHMATHQQQQQQQQYPHLSHASPQTPIRNTLANSTTTPQHYPITSFYPGHGIHASGGTEGGTTEDSSHQGSQHQQQQRDPSARGKVMSFHSLANAAHHTAEGNGEGMVQYHIQPSQQTGSLMTPQRNATSSAFYPANNVMSSFTSTPVQPTASHVGPNGDDGMPSMTTAAAHLQPVPPSPTANLLLQRQQAQVQQQQRTRAKAPLPQQQQQQQQQITYSSRVPQQMVQSSHPNQQFHVANASLPAHSDDSTRMVVNVAETNNRTPVRSNVDAIALERSSSALQPPSASMSSVQRAAEGLASEIQREAEPKDASIQALSYQMGQIAEHLAASVTQNQTVISLLQRLVAQSDNAAQSSVRHGGETANDSQAHRASQAQQQSSNGATVTQRNDPSMYRPIGGSNGSTISNDSGYASISERAGLPAMGEAVLGLGLNTTDKPRPTTAPTDGMLGNTGAVDPSHVAHFGRQQNDGNRNDAVDGLNRPHGVHAAHGHQMRHSLGGSGDQTMSMMHGTTLPNHVDHSLQFVADAAPQSSLGQIRSGLRDGQRGVTATHGEANPLDPVNLSHASPARFDADPSAFASHGFPSPVFDDAVDASGVGYPTFDMSGVSVTPRRATNAADASAVRGGEGAMDGYRTTTSNTLAPNVSHSNSAMARPQSTTDHRGRPALPTPYDANLGHEGFSASAMSDVANSSPSTTRTTSKKRKATGNAGDQTRSMRANGRGTGSALNGDQSYSADTTRGDAGDQTTEIADSWTDWLEPRMPPAEVMRTVPKARYRTAKQVRQERKEQTKRTIATIGRIPLKTYLEVGDKSKYHQIRKLARTLYNAWLEPGLRVGKQDPQRLLACYHRIEYDFPILIDCENHWKARELMLQVLDNAKDEVTYHKRKEERLQGTQEDSEAPRPATGGSGGNEALDASRSTASMRTNSSRAAGHGDGSAAWDGRTNASHAALQVHGNALQSTPMSSHPSQSDQQADWDAAHVPGRLDGTADGGPINHQGMARRGATIQSMAW